MPFTQQTYEPIDEAIRKGYSFLVDNLWDEGKGAYRECPSPNPEGKDKNYSGDDNYLAYIFHTDYLFFKNETKAQKIMLFFDTNPENLGRGVRRWIVLSHDYSRFSPYNNNEYADRVALDGIYYAKIGDMEKAKERFNFLISNMYNSSIGLIEDKATSENGHEYYKLGLALILAVHLKNRTYSDAFVDKLLNLQQADGSWLTDDKDLETTYPNAETTIIILVALDISRTQEGWTLPLELMVILVILIIVALGIYGLYKLFRRWHE
jgi:hypothetical protein